MELINIKVPENVRYISEWLDFNLPQGHCIINKTVCGCGFTEYCLTNSLPTILCSPRKILLENKEEQHKGDNVFLVKNELESILEIDLGDKSAINLNREIVIDENSKTELILKLIDSIKEYIYLSEYGTKFIPKILVTYDSLKHVLKALNSISLDYKKKFYIIVDEFQSIFLDSRFKADVELNFVEYLQDCPNVIYLSATPMMKEYLDQMEEFRNLPYYEFDWGNRIIKPIINRVKTTNLEQSALEIIKAYQEGNTETKTNVDGIDIKSEEVVFYCNNIGMVTSIIKKAKLTSDQVNIIIAQTLENKRKISKCGKGFRFGSAPLKGKPHKMFTFCTSTAYCGVDFYSTNAKTIVLSDCNLRTMTIDISLDLPQIIGRQRLEENPFRYEVLFFYTTTIEDLTREDLEKYIKNKEYETNILIKDYLDTKDDVTKIIKLDRYRELIRLLNYQKDYVGISEKTGLPVLNNLVLLSEIRAWEVQQLNYKDDISILGNLEKIGSVNKSDKNLLVNKIYSFSLFKEKMRLICEEYKKNPNTDIFNYLPSEYKNYIDEVGIEEIEKSGYRKLNLKIKKRKKIELNDKDLKVEIYKLFQIGERYTLLEIKNKLGDLFNGLGIKSLSPKASFLEKYFNVKRIKMSINREREHGYEILSIKS